MQKSLQRYETRRLQKNKKIKSKEKESGCESVLRDSERYRSEQKQKKETETPAG